MLRHFCVPWVDQTHRHLEGGRSSDQGERCLCWLLSNEQRDSRCRGSQPRSALSPGVRGGGLVRTPVGTLRASVVMKTTPDKLPECRWRRGPPPPSGCLLAAASPQ